MSVCVQDSRRAFTLVELLVALALTLFIMSILAEAFVAGADSFLRLKAIGDLDRKLRTAVTAMRRDLAADHFEGHRRLSDPDFWHRGPPREGFFRIWQGSPASATGPVNFVEGTDADGLPSYRSGDHLLHFTVRLRGNGRADFVSASVPPLSPLLTADTTFFGVPTDARCQDTPAVYTSQWAEVAYFLRPTGDLAVDTPRYALYRRQRAVVPDTRLVNTDNAVTLRGPADLAAYGEISCAKTNPDAAVYPDALYFNNPTDLTVPPRRLGMDPARDGGWPRRSDGRYPTLADAPATDLQGADLLLTDVISFDVRLMVSGGSDFVDLEALGPGANPLFNQPGGPRVFDSWSQLRDDRSDYSAWAVPGTATSVPLPIRLIALQVTLRVWDAKAQRPRQVTMMVNL